jgi:hypothetical protein
VTPERPNRARVLGVQDPYLTGEKLTKQSGNGQALPVRADPGLLLPAVWIGYVPGSVKDSFVVKSRCGHENLRVGPRARMEHNARNQAGLVKFFPRPASAVRQTSFGRHAASVSEVCKRKYSARYHLMFWSSPVRQIRILFL